LSLTIHEAITLVENIALNQGWNEERTQPRKRGGMHQVKEVDMLSTKIDPLMKKLDEHDQQKKEVMHIHDSRMTCEECGGTGHTGINYPEVQEDATISTTTPIIVLNRIKDGTNKIKGGISNKDLTTQVTT
jgi:hypothetical protein